MTMSEQPILPYATPGDTGVPDVYPPVEAMLDQRCRPKDIRVHFRRASHAVQYFVTAMQRRFAVDKLGHLCEVCGGVCDQYAAMNWSVEMPRKKMELSLDSAPKDDFDTHHALCEKCFGRWSRRMKLLNHTRLGACLTIVTGLIWLFIVRGWYKGASLTIVLLPCALMIVGVAVLWSANGIAKLAAPKPIRKRLPPGLSPNWLEGPIARSAEGSRP